MVRLLHVVGAIFDYSFLWLYGPSCLPIRMLEAVWGFRHERCSDRWRAVSAIYVSLRCATPHYSSHTTSSLPQPTYETSHISTCTTCHRTCTTSVASDASFCSWIETMSFFDWLSVLPGPRPERTTATYRHLLAFTCYRITKVPDTMYQTKYPGPRRFDQDPTHWPSDPQSDSL